MPIPSNAFPPARPSGEMEPVLDRVVSLYESLETRYERLRLAYASLLEHREELDERIRTMHDMHIVTDETGVIQQVNRSAMVIAPAHRLVGTHLMDWVEASQQHRLRAIQDIARNGRDGAGEGAELQLLRDGFDPFGLVVSVQVLPVMEGRVVKALHWVLRDVNPQIDSAFQLQKPLVEFERVSECVFMTDASGLILTVNAAFTRVTGYSAAEVIGRNPRFLGSGLQDAAFYNDFWQELQSAGSWQGQIFNRKKNGEVYSEWLKVNASRAADGSVLSYTAVFYDLSRTAAPELQHQVHTLPQPLNRLI